MPHAGGIMAPLYDFVCENGHEYRDKYLPTSQTDIPVLCEECGQTMTKLLSMGRGLVWFEEGRGRLIHNLGHEPVLVTSHEQHKRLMRENKVDWATLGQGRKGCWI